MLVEKVQAAVAKSLGDDLEDHMLRSRRIKVSRAAIEAVFDWLEKPSKAVVYAGIKAVDEAVDWSRDSDGPYVCTGSSDYAWPAYKAMLAAMRKEALEDG